MRAQRAIRNPQLQPFNRTVVLPAHLRQNEVAMSVTLLPGPIEIALREGSAAKALAATIQHFGCQAGTVHRLAADGALELMAHLGIPPHIVDIVRRVPIGKGIAGLAAERREPITICNLQTDTSGAARPAAKSTGMEGSIAVPMLLDEAVHGVLGIAKASAHNWSAEETAELQAIATRLAAIVKR
jgi:L-methionine (R)-S-oxide reductase